MREAYLTQEEICIPFFFADKLDVELHRHDLACTIIKVNRCCTLLHKFNALHPYLIKLFDSTGLVRCIGTEHVDEVLLFRFIALNQYNLLQTRLLIQIYE